MSVRAYLMERNEVDSERNECWKYEEFVYKEEFFNIWRQTNVFDLFRYFGFDGTNKDCIGELELTDEQYEEFLENKKENTKNWTDYDFESLNKIDKYFKDGNWLLQLKCF